ncbi:hypothetical protein GEMRC1_011972 [Eukaryota sp. GEM-RC1]
MTSSPPATSFVSCPICLDPQFSQPVTTKCGHIFCFKCLSSWTRTDSSCPVCNNSINISDCIRIHGVPERETVPEDDDTEVRPPTCDYTPRSTRTAQQRVHFSHPVFGPRVAASGVFPFSFSFHSGLPFHHPVHHGFAEDPFLARSPRTPNPEQARAAKKQMLVFFLVLFLLSFILQMFEVIFL